VVDDDDDNKSAVWPTWALWAPSSGVRDENMSGREEVRTRLVPWWGLEMFSMLSQIAYQYLFVWDRTPEFKRPHGGSHCSHLDENKPARAVKIVDCPAVIV
jgi:hypothetical protein